MALGWIRQFLLADVERDPAFRQELLSAKIAGLQVIAAASTLLGAFLAVVLWPHAAYPSMLVLLGGATFAVAAIKRLAKYGRWVAIGTVWAAVALLCGGPEHDYIPMGAPVLVLTAAGTVPLPPWRALLLAAGAHLICTALVPASTTRHLYFLMLTLLSTLIVIVRYEHRAIRFLAHLRALRENEILSTAQLRAQLSENAVSVARLAAALTHELNSPLGALKSAVDTLVSLAGRCVTAGPEEQQRLSDLQRDLQGSVQQSAARLQAVVARLQRFAELEQTDLREAPINELLDDAALQLEKDGRERSNIEFHFTDTPPVICRPHQLTTVFANLISNAFNAMNGEGKVVVTTMHRAGSVEIAIRDHGRGMTSEDLEHIFDPGFRVEGSRVSTANWSLFGTRQIIFEHGGDIAIDSAPGVGTTVRVTLPA
jgi:signal transduction histidine kinase